MKLNMESVREAAKTTGWGDWRSGCYTEIFLDTNTGEIWAIEQIGLGHSNWTVYHDPDVLKIGEFDTHVSAKTLVERINDRLEEVERFKQYEKQHSN